MAGLAQRYGVTEAELLQAQVRPEQATRSPLQVGTPIRVPRPRSGWPQLVVSAHLTLWRICHCSGAILEEVREANLLVGDAIEAGQSLALPGADAAAVRTRLSPFLPQATEGVQVLPAPPSLPARPEGGSPEQRRGLGGGSAPSSSEAVRQPEAHTAGASWLEVRLPDGRAGWVPASLALLPAEQPQGRARVLEVARAFLGTPYLWGGRTPNGADCSGFVQEVFRLAGHAIPRVADAQYEKLQPLPAPALEEGDLVFFSTYEPGPSHVGIYVGDQRFIHASSSRGVTVSALTDSYYTSRFLGARRPLAWPLPAAAAQTKPAAVSGPLQP